MKFSKLLILLLLLSVTPTLPTTEIKAEHISLDDAMRLRDKAIAGDAQAQYELGIYYEENGVYKTALEWYQKAYNNGYQKAKDKINKVEQKVNKSDERKPYKTKITYNNLVRNPNDYEGQKVAFYGKVVAIDEGKVNRIFLAVNGKENCIIYGEYKPSIVSSRILEGDNIIIYGVSTGLVKIGEQDKVPGVDIKIIDTKISFNDINSLKS